MIVTQFLDATAHATLLLKSTQGREKAICGMMDSEEEADEIMKDEACDSLQTSPATASELHLTPVDFPRTQNPTWTRTRVGLSYSQEVGSSST